MNDPQRRFAATISAAAVAALVLTAAPAARAERPSSQRLVLLGVGLALPIYVLDVALHEGSHAAVARLFGAEILEMRVLPSKYEGRWYFGLTRWQGSLERDELAWVLAAPSLVHGSLLTAYSLFVATGSLPGNAYGQLALAAVATGSWVDFTKDIFAWSQANDLIKLHGLYGRTREGQRFPYRVLNAALSAAAGYFLVQGYVQLFSGRAEMPMTVPIYATPF